MKAKISISLLLVSFFISCNEENKHKGKPIVMGDASTIVTEVDSQYLQNFTEDITPVDKKSSDVAITKMMVQVDSANTTKKMNEENLSSKPINGFTINFNECSVVFDGLAAHALNNHQDERNAKSVSYVKDGGEILNMKLEIKGLENIKVEERITTKLLISNATENYILNDLNKFTSPWYNLAGKENLFVSVSNNSIQFYPFDKSKLKNAFDRELRKKKKSNSETTAILKIIDNTNSYADQPCKIEIASAQWRIFGIKDGKKIQKLIQIDIP